MWTWYGLNCSLNWPGKLKETVGLTAVGSSARIRGKRGDSLILVDSVV